MIIPKEKVNMKKKSILKDRNSFSKTDHDATFMRMKEDHMKMANLSQDTIYK